MHMKKSFITLFLALVAFQAISQVTRIDTVNMDHIIFPKKKGNIQIQNSFSYTIALKGLGIEQYPKILNQTNSSDLHTSYLNGLLFKYNDNQISYRFSGSLIKESIRFKNECNDCEDTEGKLSDYQFRTGFEKSILYTRLQPYFGASIGYRNNKFKGSSKAAGSSYTVTPYDVVAEKSGFIMGPLAGLRFNLIDHLTISSEVGFDVFYSHERQEKTFSDLNRTKTVQTKNRMDFLTKPLAMFSLQYNFGLND